MILKNKLNYLERITLSNLTHKMSIVDLMDINMETPWIDSECSLEEKNFNKMIYINP